MSLLFSTINEDILAIKDRDPAARSSFEIILSYPGLHALWGHRISHWLWNHHLGFLGRLNSQLVRSLTGIEIHPGAKIGPGFFIDHGMGVVIGETTEIGKNVTIYHGVTLGGVSLEKGKRHPTLEDNVVVGAGAKILGAIVIGESSRIGANAVVVKQIPPNSVVVGVPGQIVARSHPKELKPDLHHDLLPDTIGISIASMMARMDALERRVQATKDVLEPVLEQINGQNGNNGNGNGGKNGSGGYPHPPDHGIWHGEDFMI
jgi:serine O-acetyltransferase